MKKIIIVSLLFIATACSIIAIHHAVCRAPAKPTQSDPPALKEWVNNSMADLPPGYVPRYQWAGDTERAQLESAWANAATNLMNGNMQGMNESVMTVSERMRSVSPEQFYGIVRPCYDFLKGEFMGGILTRSYADASEFKKRAQLDIDGMNVLGDVELASAIIPKLCAFLEADALAMARKAIRKFSEEGREDFVSIAKELEELIIRQIESEDGLVRRYMNADLKMQMLLFERGYSTRENVIRGVRTDAWHLEKTAGYIPKWLDEFK